MASDTAAPVVAPCWKCSGEGVILAFQHIADGVCFACDGTGRVSVGRDLKATRPAWTLVEFQRGFILWQFAASVRDFSDPDDYGRPLRPGERANDVLLQAVTRSPRSRTLFRIRLVRDEAVAVARRIYLAAQDGIAPAEITDDWLGFKPGPCQVARNKRGIDLL